MVRNVAERECFVAHEYFSANVPEREGVRQRKMVRSIQLSGVRYLLMNGETIGAPSHCNLSCTVEQLAEFHKGKVDSTQDGYRYDRYKGLDG